MRGFTYRKKAKAVQQAVGGSEAEANGESVPRPHAPLKYQNTKTENDGFSFDSKLESSVYSLLKLMQSAGEIKDIKVKPNVFLTDADLIMIPDFSAVYVNTGELFYIEAKGFETDVWRIKKRLWKFYGPGSLHIWKGTAKSPKMVECIVPRDKKQTLKGE